MEYLNGQKLKPYSIGKTGVVMFTDDTEVTAPNEEQCLAYGYKYDKETGVCYAFIYHESLNFSLQSENNFNIGSENTPRVGTNNSCVAGEKNLLKGLSRNNIVGRS